MFMYCWVHVCCIRYSVSSLFFFFKQKTAYEMRISDWSSDVCSSDLVPGRRQCYCRDRKGCDEVLYCLSRRRGFAGLSRECDQGRKQIGRASCRERVCQYV